MGDRANIVVKSDGDQVCLYTHWLGSEISDILKSALRRGKDRHDDFQYLTRIIFCEMVQGDVMGSTGFGISQTMGDGQNHVITVDVDNQVVDDNGKKFK